MRTTGLVIFTLFLSAGAQAQDQALPPSVKAGIEESRKSCAPEKFVKKAGFVTRKDVNGDGIDDFILDYGKVKCGDSSTYFCGSAGCTTQVFASLSASNYAKVLDENVQDLRFKRIRGRPAMLLGLHGSACGRTGAERCGSKLYWNGSRFSPAD